MARFAYTRRCRGRGRLAGVPSDEEVAFVVEGPLSQDETPYVRFVPLEPPPPDGIPGSGDRCRGPLARWPNHPRHRQLLRGAAHLRDGCAPLSSPASRRSWPRPRCTDSGLQLGAYATRPWPPRHRRRRDRRGQTTPWSERRLSGLAAGRSAAPPAAPERGRRPAGCRGAIGPWSLVRRQRRPGRTAPARKRRLRRSRRPR